MPRRMEEKRGFEVSKLTTPGLHPVGGVPGLYLNVANAEARSWILRLSVAGKRRAAGLGPYPEVSLVQARGKAKEARELARSGVDPIDAARSARSLLAADRARQLTFDACAEAFIRSHAAGWRNAKHADQWTTTLRDYASPVLGKLLVRDIDTAHVMKVLEPIWTTKTETASRVRSRLERILGWAATSGYRAGDNPARWRGHLENLLPKRSKVATVQHFAALDWREIGAFMARLREQQGTGARALEFAILTAARSGEVRGAIWQEINTEEALWTIPASRMKAAREHRVPLSKAVLELLRAVPRMAGTDLVFPNGTGDKLSDMTLTAVLRRMGVGVTAHGFRSTFRDWCAEATNYPREVAEASLAHTLGDKVEAAYRRGDLLKKRGRLMHEWAAHCARVQAVGSVTAINAVA